MGLKKYNHRKGVLTFFRTVECCPCVCSVYYAYKIRYITLNLHYPQGCKQYNSGKGEQP